jgi:hypothetical protein
MPGTPAANAGLKAGDCIVAFDQHIIVSAGDLTDRLDRTSANSDAVLEYVRGTHRRRLTLRTGSRPPLAPTSPDDAPAAKVAESLSGLPREAQQRIERLERRLLELEKLAPPSSAQVKRADSGVTP